MSIPSFGATRRARAGRLAIAAATFTIGVLSIAGMAGAASPAPVSLDPDPGIPAAQPAAGAKATARSVTCAKAIKGAGSSKARATTAVAVSLAESGCNPKARHVNSDSRHTVDRGAWQINSYWHKEVSDACAYDLNCNARAAYRISSSASNWNQWSTYKSGAYKRYLSEAQAGVNAAY